MDYRVGQDGSAVINLQEDLADEASSKTATKAVGLDSSLDSFRLYRAYSDDPGLFVADGYAFDIDSTDYVRPADAKRAATVKAELGEEPVQGIEGRHAYRFVKRAFDIVFSVAVLILFCWLYAIIAIVIKVDDPKGPVIFKQERVGKGGKPFTMYKFRTMCVDAESKLDELQELNEKTGPVFKIADDPRITRVGKWLRKLSMASVIIGTPGDGESTKPLSHSTKTSLDQQLCERRPELVSCASTHYTSPKFLSFGVLRGFSKGGNGAFERRNTHQNFKVKSSAINVGFALKSLDGLSSTSFGNSGRCSAIEAVAA